MNNDSVRAPSGQALAVPVEPQEGLAPSGFDPSRITNTCEDEGPKCPYCGRQYTADDPYYYRHNYKEETCDNCGLTFAVNVYTSTTWTCTRRDVPEGA